MPLPPPPHGPSPRPTPPPENVVNPSSQVPLATSTAPPSVTTTVSTASTRKTTGLMSSTMASSTLRTLRPPPVLQWLALPLPQLLALPVANQQQHLP